MVRLFLTSSQFRQPRFLRTVYPNSCLLLWSLFLSLGCQEPVKNCDLLKSASLFKAEYKSRPYSWGSVRLADILNSLYHCLVCSFPSVTYSFLLQLLVTVNAQKQFFYWVRFVSYIIHIFLFFPHFCWPLFFSWKMCVNSTHNSWRLPNFFAFLIVYCFIVHKNSWGVCFWVLI